MASAPVSQEEGVLGDLSNISVEEVRRIFAQALVRSLGSSLQVAHSRRGAKAQADGFFHIAKGQMQEVTHEQLLQAKAELQQALEDKQASEAANLKLREDCVRHPAVGP